MNTGGRGKTKLPFIMMTNKRAVASVAVLREIIFHAVIQRPDFFLVFCFFITFASKTDKRLIRPRLACPHDIWLIFKANSKAIPKSTRTSSPLPAQAKAVRN